ncbi:site-specific integrase [Hydrogenophaga sp.]|uniref:site-specific integrase n=1 Tax=Hydrogenophaga sp. TaxID=1904254 RepID=UPI002631141F|nr:site-specific integrase [Hydrogenophaga sp.]MDM7948291.1 site-specific integrase [Hydrogenophaga sp.]
MSQYLTAAIADNTRRAYQQDLRDFLAWGGVIPCGPETLAAYIADRADTASAHTITRRVVGIGRAHVSQGHADPAKTDLVRTVMRGVRRVKGTSQRQVSPLLKADILAMTEKTEGLRGVRDRALILVGFAAALRRSELATLDFGDVEFVREGLVIHLRTSKTDQEGAGRKIGVPWGRTSACPVKALENWLSLACIVEGPVFRSVTRHRRIRSSALSAQSIALILKSRASAVGLSANNISGHSLRSGLVTSAIQAGVAVHKIQQQTGHKSLAMLNRYIRDASLFDSNAAGGVL